MNFLKLLRYAVSLLMVGWLSACTDRHETVSPGTERLRVKTITQQTPNAPTKVSAFRYDGQGRLSLIIAYQSPDSTVAPVENTVYTYDAQNRLTQVQRTVAKRGTNAETYTLTYNGAGQVAELRHAPSTFRITHNYPSGNQASGYNKAIGVNGLTSSGGGTFTFTGNNLTLVTENFQVGRSGGPSVPVFSRSTSTTYTFDDKVNPFYGVYIIPAPGMFGPMPISGSFGPYYTYYGGIDNFFNLSQNNVLSGGDKTYAYTYNNANLPTSRITTIGGTTVETLQYEYEAY